MSRFSINATKWYQDWNHTGIKSFDVGGSEYGYEFENFTIVAKQGRTGSTQYVLECNFQDATNILYRSEWLKRQMLIRILGDNIAIMEESFEDSD